MIPPVVSRKSDEKRHLSPCWKVNWVKSIEVIDEAYGHTGAKASRRPLQSLRLHEILFNQFSRLPWLALRGGNIPSMLLR